MKKLLLLAALLTLALGAVACGEPESPSAPQASPEPELSELSIEEAARRFAAGEAVPVDANSSTTRSDRGVVPGAVLLTSSGSYDCDAELPDDHDAHLVFYCGNSNCRASDGAARRALQAGYDNVHVMREGIAGWVEAGQETDTPPS